MSEHDSASSTPEQGGLESRFIPGAHIEARDITAINVVSGVQNIAEQHVHLPGQKYVPPLQLPRRAEHFQDRASECAWLLAHLQPGQIVTICGPGGMGKTALVAEVLWTLAPGDNPPKRFPHGIVFHSFYGRPEAAVALEQLARTFGEDPLPTPKQAAQRALSNKHVLLVLDGAEEAENLEQVLSVCASCAVLVTSRRRSDAADTALLLDLQRLPTHDAVAVVQAWQTQRETNAAVIERIVQLVGGLPLALRLVGSYLALHPDEAEEYLAWLEEDLFEALNQGSTTRKSVPLLLERSVARLSSDGRSVLSVIGMLALAPFERELVVGVLELAPRAASQALGELVDYGLLVQVGTAYEVSHPLIHTYARQMLPIQHDEIKLRTFVERLINVLFVLFPEVTHTNWADCERLLPHIQACAAHLEQQEANFKKAAIVFNQAGNYLHVRARYEQAALLYQRALTINEQVLGPDHPETADTLNNLANLYRQQGKYKQAVPLFQRALAINEQVLGSDHLSSAASLNNLALLYLQQGKYVQAEPLLGRALAINEQALGSDHPETAVTLNNMAWLYKDQGKYEQAALLYQRALAIKEQVLGSDHPETAVTLNNLALFYSNQRKYEQAELLFQRALIIRERVWGLDHPQTANTLANIAFLYTLQGKYKQAEPLYQRGLAILEQTRGLDHPSTAIVLVNLASLYTQQGKYKQAEPLYQRGLAILEQTLEPNHPDIVATLENYAYLLRKVKRSNEAIPLEQRARAIQTEGQYP